MTTDQLIAGLIGALISSIFLPLVTYFFIRILNRSLVCVFPDTPRNESDYRVFNLRLRNRSPVTLKNVIAYISINNNANDIILPGESLIGVFNTTTAVNNSLLSWSKNLENKNLPTLNINQGEIPDLNLIRYHIAQKHRGIEIASEQGFWDGTTQSRIVLKSNRPYHITIKITGENFWPKTKKYVFDPEKSFLMEK
ncbi:MAG TPA: hypothetical protein PLA68_13050 [Panacibacter sp.]|nr:hypothetical protein [Panacibacter sp.]